MTPGTLLVASAPRGWSWAVIEDISDRFVYSDQISAPKPQNTGHR